MKDKCCVHFFVEHTYESSKKVRDVGQTSGQDHGEDGEVGVKRDDGRHGWRDGG